MIVEIYWEKNYIATSYSDLNFPNLNYVIIQDNSKDGLSYFFSKSGTCEEVYESAYNELESKLCYERTHKT